MNLIGGGLVAWKTYIHSLPLVYQRRRDNKSMKVNEEDQNKTELNTQPLLSDESENNSKINNQSVLAVTTVLFGLFVIAEIVGALASNSLSLLGDASAMIVDTFTYFCNMYAERVKAKYGVLDDQTRRILEVYIPSFSVAALLAVTGYIVSDAVAVIQNGGGDDDVEVIFLWAFSSANFLVDLFSSLMFYWRGKEVLVDNRHAPLRTFSLDRQSFDMAKRPLIPLPNLNMLSALTHVGGDTLRTASVFIAALVSTVGGVEGSLCDAWASIVVSISIGLCVIPLCSEIFKAYKTSSTQDHVYLTLNPENF